MRGIFATGLAAVLAVGLGAVVLAADAPATKSVTGTPEDSFCWGTMGASGPSHKKCAIGCAKAGIPVTLVEKGSGDAYVLLPPKDAEALPSDLVAKMEDEVTVTGKEFSKSGVKYLTVESVK
ncbi:MAG TPA: hypothetical protein VEF03_01370 [Candidatus Binataceae bacterium]|nr:hypothetical protein [Candidatus Binataceae bacterium]